jgi:hypothetical protein
MRLGPTAREPAQAERARGDEVGGARRSRELGIVSSERARHGAKIAQVELELCLRAAQQMPVGIAQSRFDGVVALSSNYIPRFRAPLLASEPGARAPCGGRSLEALMEYTIPAFMRVARAHRRIGKASLDRGRVRFGARGWRGRARIASVPEAKGEQQGRRKARAFPSTRDEANGAHHLLFDWAS